MERSEPDRQNRTRDGAAERPRRMSAAERRRHRRKTALLWVLFYAAGAVLIFCIVDFVFTLYERKAAREQYSQMQAAYEIQVEDAGQEGADMPEETVDPDKWYAPYARIADRRIDFAALEARNADVCAWIKVEGTTIDYPLLMSPTAETPYLTHDIDGKASEHGTICMDARCKRDFSGRVSMIYGHNMLDGSMFAPLYSFYKDSSFFDADHKVILYLDNVMLTYRVVAAYEYGHEQPLYYYNNMLKDEDFLRYCDTFLSNRDLKARIRESVSIAPEDHVLTLVTSTNVRADRRLFVQAVLLDVA